ncbi:20482_t:CDS:1, partial [Racocetra persica]
PIKNTIRTAESRIDHPTSFFRRLILCASLKCRSQAIFFQSNNEKRTLPYRHKENSEQY